MVKYLVELGTDINKEANNGGTALFEACERRNLNIIKF